MKTFPERETIRRIADSTIQHMELLRQALDAADFHEERANHFASIIEQQSADLSFARERTQQDEATIQLKENQMNLLIDSNNKLKLENERLNESLISCENKVQTLQEKFDNSPVSSSVIES